MCTDHVSILRSPTAETLTPRTRGLQGSQSRATSTYLAGQQMRAFNQCSVHALAADCSSEPLQLWAPTTSVGYFGCRWTGVQTSGPSYASVCQTVRGGQVGVALQAA